MIIYHPKKSNLKCCFSSTSNSKSPQKKIGIRKFMEKYEITNRFQEIIKRKRAGLGIPRCYGKTTLMCHEVCAQIELGEQKHIFIHTNHTDPVYLYIALNDAFKKHDLSPKWKMNNWTCEVNGTTICLIDKTFNKKTLVGYKDYVEFKDE